MGPEIKVLQAENLCLTNNGWTKISTKQKNNSEKISHYKFRSDSALRGNWKIWLSFLRQVKLNPHLQKTWSQVPIPAQKGVWPNHQKGCGRITQRGVAESSKGVWSNHKGFGPMLNSNTFCVKKVVLLSRECSRSHS